MTTIQRRDFLKKSTLMSLGAALPPLLLAAHGAEAQSNNYRNPLAIPPEVTGEYQGGRRAFELSLEHGQTQFLSGANTPTIGINGAYLGPVIRVNRGERVSFRVRNRLAAPTTLHWHGLNLPAVMDGGPHQVIGQGEIWEPEFEIRQSASTLWYHSHIHRGTGPQVYQGLAGLLFIDDPGLVSQGLPTEYGVDDVPLIIQDRSFRRDGGFLYLSNMHDRMAGMHGNRILVNGTYDPALAVTKRLTRFRILNGSNARIYNLAFSDNRSFIQIASDGGFLDTPVVVSALRLAPGERAEILVQFDRGDRVFLRHKPLPRPAGAMGMGMMRMMAAQGTQPFPIMAFTAADISGDLTIPPDLTPNPTDTSAFGQTVTTRNFRLDMSMGMGMMAGRANGFTINGQSFDMGRIDVVSKRGEPEIWRFYNGSPMPHPIHIHNIQFRVLSRNGNPPSSNERGPKDTVLVDPDETVHLGLRFEHYADERTPYMFHCHNLEHEDQGMMGQFVVV